MKKLSEGNKVTWAQMARDVLITAMNKGQLPLLLILTGSILVLYRIPEDDLSALVLKIIQGLKDGALIGYILVILLLIAWYWDGRNVRREYAKMHNLYQKLLQKTSQKTSKKTGALK